MDNDTKKEPTLASHKHLLAFLRAREKTPKKNDNVEGEERKQLMAEVWPLLTAKQRERYGTVDSFRYYKWLTETMASLRKYTIQPQKINHRFVSSTTPIRKPGDANNHTKDFQKKKNQKPHILRSKANHELNNPFRWRKHHGTANKKAAQTKYRMSEKGMEKEIAAAQRRKRIRQRKRNATLRAELQRYKDLGITEITPEEVDSITNDVMYTAGKVVDEFPDKSLDECVAEKKVVAYAGLCTWQDRLDYEPWRFLVQGNKNRPVLQWQPDPSTPSSLISIEEAKHMLGFKTKVVHERASMCGFQSYMIERTIAQALEKYELGTQKLNRFRGTGNPYRGVAGHYHVFVTYALTSTLEQFNALAVIPNLEGRRKKDDEEISDVEEESDDYSGNMVLLDNDLDDEDLLDPVDFDHDDASNDDLEEKEDSDNENDYGALQEEMSGDEESDEEFEFTG